ncbi:MAG: hypothetical protein IJY57_01995 [Clostridia bacterium]|nr:hypothetical protein [Clostridia bacterium]
MFKENIALNGVNAKKRYEKVEVELYEFGEDVMLASSPFKTEGTYDEIGGWQVLGSEPEL